MEQTTSPGRTVLEELFGVRAERGLVAVVLDRAEVAAVTGRAVEVVVDPLGDREEVGIASITSHLASMPSPPTCGQQRLEQLRYPAAGRGRVDVEHRATRQGLPHPGGGRLERGDALGTHDRPELGHGHRPDPDLLQSHRFPHVRA